MDAAGGFRGRHTLDAVHARFILQLGIGTLAFDLENDFLEPAHADGIGIHHLHLPVMVLGVTGIHAVQVGGKDGGFLAPRAGPDLDEDVLVITRVPGHQHLPE